VLTDQLNKGPINFSNTARVSSALNKYGLGSATGMIGLLTGHGVAASLAAGEITHLLSKSAPDATRLALLKFLGSDAPVHAPGFKAMTDFIQAASRGESLTTDAVKNFFQAGAKVLPEGMLPDRDSRDALKKAVDAAKDPQASMNSALNTGQDLSKYLPGHVTAAVATRQAALNYLTPLDPRPGIGKPLDNPAPISSQSQARYDRALDIAQQPLMVLHHAKSGTLLPQDLQTLNAIYPALHKSIASQLGQELVNAKTKGTFIPPHQRLGLSMLTGMPVDSTYTVPVMQSIQMANRGAQLPQPGMPGKKPRAPSAKALTEVSKGAGLYATGSQARELERKA
jgi:hypothetical protein